MYKVRQDGITQRHATRIQMLLDGGERAAGKVVKESEAIANGNGNGADFGWRRRRGFLTSADLSPERPEGNLGTTSCVGLRSVESGSSHSCLTLQSRLKTKDPVSKPRASITCQQRIIMPDRID